MGRLSPEVLDRVTRFGHRVVDVGEHLTKENKPRRIVEQIVAAGTAVGANVYEADEAVSSKDFCRCLGIAVRELSEMRFWLRIVTERNWIEPARLADLIQETDELRKVLGSMIVRTRPPTRGD